MGHRRSIRNYSVRAGMSALKECSEECPCLASTQMTAELALKAVQNACLNVPDTEGIILQSDLGTQYTSEIFEKYLAKNKIRHSFSRKGCPYDNACIESFHSLIKKEEIYRHNYRDSKEAYDSIFEYIESWYNRQRTHSSLGYKTPAAVHAGGAA